MMVLPSLGHLLSLPFADARIAIERYTDGGTMVVRAELPGRDPAKEIQVAVMGGELRIRAERSRPPGARVDGDVKYAAAYRAVRLPPAVEPDAITARYHRGILEVRVPTSTAPASPTRPDEQPTIPATTPLPFQMIMVDETPPVG